MKYSSFPITRFISLEVIDEEEEELDEGLNTLMLKSFKKTKTMPTSAPSKKKPKPNGTQPRSKKAQNVSKLSKNLKIEIDNLDMTKEEGLNAIFPKYTNEMNFYNYLFEVFMSVWEFENEFPEEATIARFSLIKYIIFRFQNFEKKVLEKSNIFVLPEWENLKNSKEYLKILKIVPKKLEQAQWYQFYLDLGREVHEIMNYFFDGKRELDRYSTSEKHFLKIDTVLNVMYFYKKAFQEVFQSLLLNLLKRLRRKEDDLARIGRKTNPRFFRIGLNILKILEINKMVGFDEFDKKMRHCFEDIRNSLDELDDNKVKELFNLGLNGLLKSVAEKQKGKTNKKYKVSD